MLAHSLFFCVLRYSFLQTVFLFLFSSYLHTGTLVLLCALIFFLAHLVFFVFWYSFLHSLFFLSVFISFYYRSEPGSRSSKNLVDLTGSGSAALCKPRDKMIIICHGCYFLPVVPKLISCMALPLSSGLQTSFSPPPLSPSMNAVLA